MLQLEKSHELRYVMQVYAQESANQMEWKKGRTKAKAKVRTFLEIAYFGPRKANVPKRIMKCIFLAVSNSMEKFEKGDGTGKKVQTLIRVPGHQGINTNQRVSFSRKDNVQKGRYALISITPSGW